MVALGAVDAGDEAASCCRPVSWGLAAGADASLDGVAAAGAVAVRGARGTKGLAGAGTAVGADGGAVGGWETWVPEAEVGAEVGGILGAGGRAGAPGFTLCADGTWVAATWPAAGFGGAISDVPFVIGSVGGRVAMLGVGVKVDGKGAEKAAVLGFFASRGWTGTGDVAGRPWTGAFGANSGLFFSSVGGAGVGLALGTGGAYCIDGTGGLSPFASTGGAAGWPSGVMPQTPVDLTKRTRLL